MREPFAPLSEREIRESIWVLEHRRRLGKTLVVSLIVLDSALLLLVVFGMVKEFGSLQSRKEMERESVGSGRIRAFESPLPIRVNRIETVTEKTTMDLVAEVENQNQEFEATIEYTFTVAGRALGSWVDVVPARTRSHLVAVGVSRIKNALIQFEPRTVRWQRTRAHEQGRYAEFKAHVGEVRVKDSARYPTLFGTGVRFTLVNDTAFHLRQIPTVILLWRGETLVGVNTVVAEYVPSQAQRSLDVRWSESLEASTSMTVEPHVNLLDESNRYVPTATIR